MSVRGLDWQTWTLRFTGGIDQKTDSRALESPDLAVCKDVVVDKVGALTTRPPFATDINSIQGGSTLANTRKLIDHNGESLCFTDTALYSYNASTSTWFNVGTHLAVDVDEQLKFASNGDQFSADRAELNDVVVYTWSELGAWVAAYNKTTGTVIQPPIIINGIASGDARTRVVAAGDKILLFYVAGTGTRDLMGFAIDPADVASSIAAGLGGAATTIYSQASGFNLMYDVCKIPSANSVALAARLNPTTSYRAFTITSALSITGSTKARVCVGPIAVSCTADGTKLQIVRDAGNIAGTLKIRGDLISISSFATDLFTDQEIGTYTLPTPIGTTVLHIAAAHRSTPSGGGTSYRCYAFWGFEQDGLAEAVKYNWVDTGNTLGTEAMLLAWCQLGSRAFEYNGSVYVWAVYSRLITTGSQQGQYLLYRDDGFLTASSRVGNAFYVKEAGCLPTVSLTDGTTGFRWAGVFERKVTTTNNFGGFTARAPREIYFTFDSDNARRTVRFGRTLYISGSPLLQYDGVRITEVGFLSAPVNWGMVDSGVAGNLSGGTYAYKATLRSMNGTGEVERSTHFGVNTITVAASKKTVSVTSASNNPAVWTTRKDGVSWEIWRTLVNPTADAPFYLATSQDPSAAAPNNYLQNSRTGVQVGYPWTDNLSDAVIALNESDVDDLESIPPPSARILMANGSRLFLAGVAGDPDRVWYSKNRNDGEIASFNDVLTADVPKPGGQITALAFLNGTLVVFKETAIYELPGDGFDNIGGGQNYGPARQISVDIGAVRHEAVAVTDHGIVFHSSKGKWLLDRGWQVQPFGVPVVDYDSETPVAVHVVKSKHEVRWLTTARVLVFNTLVNKWSEWTITGGLDATTGGGTYRYLTSTGPKTEQSAYTLATYGIDVETAWIKLNDLQGFGAIDFFQLLGEFRSACTVRIRLARDYWKDGDGVYFQDKTHTPSLTAGKPFELQHSPSIRQVKALKVRITVTPVSAGESLRLTGLAFRLGITPGLNRNLAATTKQ